MTEKRTDERLRKFGLQLCEFDCDDCSVCDNPRGKKCWYQRTCWDVDEGEYYCNKCAHDLVDDAIDQSEWIEKNWHTLSAEWDALSAEKKTQPEKQGQT